MLGDLVEQALTVVGVDSREVEAWTGKPCNCKERKEKLNHLDAWARRILKGKLDRARDYLKGIMGLKEEHK